MNRRKEAKTGFSIKLTKTEHDLLSKIALNDHDSIASWLRHVIKKETKKINAEVGNE